MSEVQAVTGPFSYTGSYIARRLVDSGIEVRGLVRLPVTAATPGIECRELQFENAGLLARDLEGVSVLYNTYWIRFPRQGMTFDQAVKNIGILARAAKRAGVGRIVHLSVSNADRNSPFAYFRGKAEAEQEIHELGPPATIIRPTLVFGREDVLINNIVWLLRRLHVFALPGAGGYRVQPVFVDDVAKLAVRESRASGSRTIDAAAPEVFTFKQLCRLLAEAARVPALVLDTPEWAVLAAGRALSLILRDVIITPDELGALMAETLVSHQPPEATTRLTDWLAQNGAALGRAYTSELRRHWDSKGGGGQITK
ncbi:MAG TPA: NAD(P)H-binding protein [Chloroflexota bacterium]|nr:NAD(P)H-binding protein [Chloroflexota bacterium]